MIERTENDLSRLSEALRAGAKPKLYEAVPDLPLVMQELDAWLVDEHQWRSGRPKNWATLLSDLDASWKKTGPALRKSLDATIESAHGETQLVRRALKQSNLPPDESMRRRLHRAAEAIRAELLQDRTLVAAWEDLLAASGPIAAAESARLLLNIGQLHGHVPLSLTRRLESIFRDDYYAVASARGEEVDPSKDDERAGASVSERTELAKVVLTELPERADVAVWLLFALAPKLWPPVLEIGDQVALYDMAWLQAVKGQTNPSYPVPKELLNEYGISLFATDRGAESDDPNRVPYVAARISLRDVRISEAEGIARASAEALIALASLHGGHACPWILEDTFSMALDDGRHGPSSFSAPAVFAPTSEQQSAMSQDWTAEVIEKNAERWGKHFPIRDARIQEAAHLLVWLRKARETWGPARLVLCDRVIERVAGWAGVASPKRLIDDHLKIHWAITGMRSECGNIVWAALNAHDSSVNTVEKHKAREQARSDLLGDPDLELNLGERSWSVSPRGAAKRLAWIEKRVPAGGITAEKIATLKNRMQSGPSAAAWADELMDEFARLEARSRRVRNALVHGGPATDQIADQVLPFVESLAESALFTSVEGRLDEEDLVDYFLDLRAANKSTLDALRRGVHPADALWSDDPASKMP